MSVRIGGVPEHFNFPWHDAIEHKLFESQGIDLKWKDFPGGTGAMCKALENKELDLALLLTEGAIKEICSGANFKILKAFVDTPLSWGIHTSSNDVKANLKDLNQMRYAISRFGSGSHLMAYVHAKENGFQLNDNQMVIVGDLQGARNALANNEADLFFWERFMTKPFVDSNEFNLLDIFPTPWPCFMLVATNVFFESQKIKVEAICEIINNHINNLSLDKENLINKISSKYHLSKSDIEIWLSSTKWNTNFEIEQDSFTKTTSSLFSLNLIQNPIKNTELIHHTVTLI